MIDQRTAAGFASEAFSLHSNCLPKGVERISVGHDSRPDGIHTTVFGWARSGRCWVLSHTVSPFVMERPITPADEVTHFGSVRGTKVTADETDADADEIDRLARESAPDADGPDDIEEREDGTIQVTSAGLADIAGWSYGIAGKWFRMTGLKGQVDLAEVERLLAKQLDLRWPAGFEEQEIVRALQGVRRHRAEHAGKRAAEADQVRAAAARYGLTKALASARAVLAADEIAALVSQAVGTGRAA